METESNVPNKKPAVSITLLFFIVTLAVIGYFAAPKVMTYIMLQQERAKAASGPIAPSSYGNRPEGLTFGSDSPAPTNKENDDQPKEN